MFHFKQKPYKEFNEWCKSEPVGEQYEDFILSRLNPNNTISIDGFNSLMETLHQKLYDGGLLNIVFDRQVDLGGDLNANCEYLISGNDEEKPTLNNLNIQQVPDQKCPLVFKNLKIRHSIIQVGGTTMKVVVLKNCDIAQLTLHQNARVTLINTKIGTLNIDQANLIDMVGGCVLNIEVPAPGGAINPLTGSVDFVNTFFPRNRKDYLLPGPQPYRNMRHHLRAIENGQMANLFHSNELAVERERDTGMNKFLSYAYQALSDFGSSATRPIVWWFGIGLLSAIIIFSTNGATPTFDAHKYPGWKAMLVADNCDFSTNAAKATYLSFSTMLNPLGLMGHRALLVPSTGWIFIVLVFQALLSAILIALMILAIRRRFKMQ